MNERTKIWLRGQTKRISSLVYSDLLNFPVFNMFFVKEKIKINISYDLSYNPYPLTWSFNDVFRKKSKFGVIKNWINNLIFIFWLLKITKLNIQEF